ncbi:MAG: imelysin family protein [Bacteroidota bacterium]
MQKQIISLFLLVVFLFSCSGSNEPSPADNEKDRQPILIHWVDNIIVPSYDNFKVKFDVMKGMADTFVATPTTTTLTELRAAWVEAYIEWQKVEMFEFGPADQFTIRNFFNIYPTDVAGIDANINNPTVNLNLPDAYARQGFPALDYLLNGVAADDAQIVAYYTTGGDGVKRLAYVKRLTDRMNTLIGSVIAGWKGSYRDTFISKTGLDIGSSMGIVVNAYVLQYERYIRSGKIGIPCGSTLVTNGTPYPEKVEAYYKKDISLVLAKTAHQAIADFFNGIHANSTTDGPSFKSYLDALEAKDVTSGTLLSDIINQQYGTIKSNLNLLMPDLSQQIQTNNQLMIDTYTSMQKAVRLLKVDMASAMSITITYTDNDGD